MNLQKILHTNLSEPFIVVLVLILYGLRNILKVKYNRVYFFVYFGGGQPLLLLKPLSSQAQFKQCILRATKAG